MLPHLPEGQAIPKVIHQTYRSKDLPPSLRANVDRLKAANPAWEHRLYDDADMETFIAEHYGQGMLAAYCRISPSRGAARADLFRYLLIYKLGGVYLDIKSAADRPLDDIIRADDRYILSQWDQGPGSNYLGWGQHPELPKGEFQQWFIIAAPGHPFLEAVIERVLANLAAYRPERDGVDKFAVFRTTGPVAYTLAILPLLGDHPHRLATSNARLGLVYSTLEGSEHVRLFKRHHTRDRSSIVRISRARAVRLWVRVHGALAAQRMARLIQRALGPFAKRNVRELAPANRGA